MKNDSLNQGLDKWSVMESEGSSPPDPHHKTTSIGFQTVSCTKT